GGAGGRAIRRKRCTGPGEGPPGQPRRGGPGAVPTEKPPATRHTGPSASRHTTTTGTRARRTTVSPLARLTSPGAAAGAVTPCDAGSVSADMGAPPDQRVPDAAPMRDSATRSTPSEATTFALMMSPTRRTAPERTVVTPSTSGA